MKTHAKSGQAWRGYDCALRLMGLTFGAKSLFSSKIVATNFCIDVPL
ncbi:hypothetical protein [Serratia nematodiphila]|nr:hypothetical protein [Serratia nematodiphila]